MKKAITILLILCTLFSIITVMDKLVDATTSTIPVLMYHRIQNCPTNTNECADVTVQPQEFKDQMQFLKDNGYVTLTIEQIHFAKVNNLPLPTKSVLITFDDGISTQYREAYPVLKANNQKAVFFIVTSVIGTSGYMTLSQIQELQRSGVGEIGSHTVTHPRLTTITTEQLNTELRDSRSYLEAIMMEPVTAIAYPNGAYNQSVIDAETNAGYHYAFITCRVNCKKGVNSQNADFNDAYRLDRRTVFPKMTINDFALLLTP
jgi:peptidoglycan/xylan/chitin deacetylase (PgdA/CDA1 family)